MLARVLVLCTLRCTLGFHFRRSEPLNFNLNETFFASLENYQVLATPAPADAYPWIARVVHSRHDIPHMCTASCVDERIFITAARCIYGLKVNYTTIIYMNSHLRTRAFVFPSNGTKQAFDDIGFLVAEPGYQGPWETVQLIDQNRTDDGFQWFADMDFSDEHKVVGYATQKGIHKIKAADRIFELTELQVIINITICHTILTFNHLFSGFNVPCYHSCSLEEFQYSDQKCNNYHGVEGGALINVNTNKLLGVATWGPNFIKYELPVGFSVPNSANFFEDYECARRIRQDRTEYLTNGHYQSLCENIDYI